MKEDKELDKPYKIRSGFKGTQPGASKRQMLSIMKTLQKIKPVKKKDGGLMEAIEKVKAKEMKFGGEAKPLVGGQKKLDKNKDGRISGDDFAMMEMGGKVQKYGGGGKVKGGKMSCRGMGAAIKGGGYTIS